MAYKIITDPFGGQFVQRLEDGAQIPMSEDNRDYRDYLAWVAAGNTLTEDVPSLDDLKAKKLADLQRRKGIALQSMQYLGYTVTLTVQDQVDVQMEIARLQSEPEGTTTRWEIVNNTFLTWTLADLLSLQTAGVLHVRGVYDNTDTLAAAITAAADQAALDAVNLDPGWPV